jgi:membrane protease YdiL (CAAX protease family)
MLLFNLAFLTNPDGIAIGFPMVSVIIAGFATGLKEEVFFRGFAFIRNGEPSPRDTVFLTTICFSLMHLLNLLSGFTIQQVEFTIIIAVMYGLSFGMMRIVTGSIAWGVLIHGAVDATVPLVNDGSRTYQVLAALLMMTTLVAGFIVFFAHPAMRKTGNANPIADAARCVGEEKESAK